MRYRQSLQSMLLAGGMFLVAAGPTAATSPTGGAPRAAVVDDVRTTDPGIAMGNFEAQIRQLERTPASALTSAQRAGFIDMLTAHARYTGRIDELARASSLSEEWAAASPNDPIAVLARARGRASFHRFAEALADLDRAAALGASATAVNGVRAGIFQASGRYDDAFAIRDAAARRNPNADNLGALAALQGERGDVETAARLFAQARQAYHDVSPFPYAFMLFDEGAMWMRHGDLARARELFAAARRHLPSYATAQCHLGEVEAALGHTDIAIALLEPLARGVDDPDAAGQLARVLGSAGRTAEAETWRDTTARRYDALLANYPDAFADHAAEFWLAAGNDPQRALGLAQHNLELRQTPRAYELVLTAAIAGGHPDVACALASRAQAASDHSPGLTAALDRATGACGGRGDQKITASSAPNSSSMVGTNVSPKPSERDSGSAT